MARSKANVVIVVGVEGKHTEGRYFLNLDNQWIDVGEDAIAAQRKRLLRLSQMEYERFRVTGLDENSGAPRGKPVQRAEEWPSGGRAEYPKESVAGLPCARARLADPRKVFRGIPIFDKPRE